MAYLFVLIVGFAAGAVSGVIGTGSSIMLLPILVFTFGPKQAIPIMAIAAIIANATRIAVWWREIDLRGVLAYGLPSIPAAALGAQTLLQLPTRLIDACLGAFFLIMIPGQRWLRGLNLRLSLWQLSLAGVVIGFLTGIVLSTGPLSIPVFLAYGLLKGALLSTEAATSLLIGFSKAATFQRLGALPLDIALHGLIVGASLMLGTLAGKQLVLRMDGSTFRRILDVMLLCSGVALLVHAVV
jgi:uncharacterized membrane protein YfcA